MRAVVVAFRAEQDDPRKRRIAYLETCTPELKDLLEEVQAARASGQPLKGRMPLRDSDFFQTNTLVKGLEETEWHASRIFGDFSGWVGAEREKAFRVKAVGTV